MTMLRLNLFKRRYLVAILGLICIVIATAIGVWWYLWYQQQHDPTIVWYKSLDHSLQIRSYVEDNHEVLKNDVGTLDYTAHVTADVSDPKQVRASSHFTYGYPTLQTEYDAIGAGDIDYVRYKNLNVVDTNGLSYGLDPSFTGKWVKGYEKNDLLKTPVEGVSPLPTYARVGLRIAGLFPAGNLPADQRGKIIHYLREHSLYGDVSKPTIVQTNGHAEYIYAFRFDAAKVAAYELYLDSVSGLQTAEKEEKDFYDTSRYQITVDPETATITRLQLHSTTSDHTKDLRFSAFNEPVSISVPTPQITPEQFNAGFKVTRRVVL